MAQKFTFREITVNNELEQAFRLRYNSYKETDLKVFLTNNAFNIDISSFDLHSKIFGIFLNNELIATNRLCVERELLFNEKVLQTGHHFGFFKDLEHTSVNIVENCNEYPFYSFFSLSADIYNYFEYLTSTHTLITECGRFAILNQYRSVRLMKFMFNCMFVFGIDWFKNQKRVVVTETFSRHTAIYKTYGFNEIAKFHYGNLESCSLLSNTIDPAFSNIPDNLRPVFWKQLAELQTTGKIETEL